MRQIFQNLKTGEVTIEHLPVPACGSGQVLIRTTASLVSLGTEKMLVDFGKASWLDKARQQPDKVHQVLAKIKTDGLIPTLNAVKNKLDQPLPLGYSAVGVVQQVGKGVTDLKPGDRVVSNGPHAENVAVARNLVSKIPDSVSDEDAAFTVVSAIGLQGIRLLNPTLGETIVVVGLGLIGLLTVQLLRANGCQVIGFDFDADKVQRAKQYGAQAFVVTELMNPVQEALNLTNGIGVDGVLITASTKSDEVIAQAAQMTRVRGRVVLVGVIGLDIKRSDFYEKEISFQVSCSYGPGRYDPMYEEMGLDYPVGFVRWTEQRNFSATLECMANSQLKVQDLITTRVKLDDAPHFYSELGGGKNELGILIQYPQSSLSNEKTIQLPAALQNSRSAQTDSKEVAVLGAGQFAGAVLLPLFARQGFRFSLLGSRSGPLGPHLAKKYGFANLTSDYATILENKNVQNVLVATRHNSHGALVLAALKQGKNVFVEKPLALTEAEIDEIENFYGQSQGRKPLLMVGFNRRFSPLAIELKKTLKNLSSSRAFVMTVNAGAIPKKHWTQDPQVGGGRLVGEGCHFIDLLRFLSNSPITQATATGMSAQCPDTFTIQLKFENGDIGTIHYFANGSKDFPKERLEVFVGGKIVVLDNFKTLKGIGLKRFKYILKSQDKGHAGEIQQFQSALSTGEPPIPLNEIFEVSRWAIKLQNELSLS